MKEYTKPKCCPECEYEYIKTKWAEGRTWKNCCHECGWASEHMIPLMGTIETTKPYSGGWSYIMYDKYNQVFVYSKAYNNEKEMMEEILRVKRITEENDYYGKCTTVIFPAGKTEGYIYEKDLCS